MTAPTDTSLRDEIVLALQRAIALAINSSFPPNATKHHLEYAVDLLLTERDRGREPKGNIETPRSLAEKITSPPAPTPELELPLSEANLENFTTINVNGLGKAFDGFRGVNIVQLDSLIQQSRAALALKGENLELRDTRDDLNLLIRKLDKRITALENVLRHCKNALEGYEKDSSESIRPFLLGALDSARGVLDG